MEITLRIPVDLPVEVWCQHCGRKVSGVHKEEARGSLRNIDVPFFNIVKRNTLGLDMLDPAEKDMYRAIRDDQYLEDMALPKPVRLVRRYFHDIQYRIKISETPKELKELKAELEKVRAVVSHEVRKEIKEQKERALGMVGKRLKGMKPKAGKRGK